MEPHCRCLTLSAAPHPAQVPLYPTSPTHMLSSPNAHRVMGLGSPVTLLPTIWGPKAQWYPGPGDAQWQGGGWRAEDPNNQATQALKVRGSISSVGARGSCRVKFRVLCCQGWGKAEAGGVWGRDMEMLE